MAVMRKVDIELVEQWLDTLDQSSYEQFVAGLELLAIRDRSWAAPWSTRWLVPGTET